MWVSRQRRILRRFQNCGQKCEKFASKKVTAKKCEKSEVLLFYITTLQKCLAKTFSGWIFFRLFPQIWNQRKILRILNTHMPKKNKKFCGVIEYIYEYMLELVECRFTRNGLTNNKHFWEYYLASFCWWISSSCENHCTLIHIC